MQDFKHIRVTLYSRTLKERILQRNEIEDDLLQNMHRTK